MGRLIRLFTLFYILSISKLTFSIGSVKSIKKLLIWGLSSEIIIIALEQCEKPALTRDLNCRGIIRSIPPYYHFPNSATLRFSEQANIFTRRFLNRYGLDLQYQWNLHIKHKTKNSTIHWPIVFCVRSASISYRIYKTCRQYSIAPKS